MTVGFSELLLADTEAVGCGGGVLISNNFFTTKPNIIAFETILMTQCNLCTSYARWRWQSTKREVADGADVVFTDTGK